MIIVMQPHASEDAVQNVVQFIRAQGLTEHLSRGTEHTIIGAVGDERVFDAAQIEALPEVERAIRIMQDWRIISREAWADDSQIIIRGIPFGGTNAPQTIAYIGSLKTAGFNEVKTGRASSCAAETEGGNETETSKPQSHAAEISEVHAPAVLLDPFYLPANPYAPDNNAGEADIARLLANAGIIRNRLKIQAAIHNAQQIQRLQQQYGSFKNWLDAHHPRSKEAWVKLFKQHFKFVGGEIVGEFLLSTGYLAGAHEKSCPQYRQPEKA